MPAKHFLGELLERRLGDLEARLSRSERFASSTSDEDQITEQERPPTLRNRLANDRSQEWCARRQQLEALRQDDVALSPIEEGRMGLEALRSEPRGLASPPEDDLGTRSEAGAWLQVSFPAST